MNNRERFLNIMAGEPVDRMPAVHFGYWKELIDEWIEQGHINKKFKKMLGDGTKLDRELDKILGWDFCYTARATAINGLIPPFKKQILAKENGGTKYQDRNGVIYFVKKGVQGIPNEIDYLLKDKESYIKHYKNKLKYSKIRNLGSSFINLRMCLPKKYYPKGYNIGSSIGKIRDLCTVLGISYMIYDDYDLLKEIVDDYNEMQYQCLKTNLERGYKYDFIHYWEDICFKNGPLISPDVFRDLCYKHYKKVSDLAQQYGIKYISVDCDGDTTLLLKTWEESGVNLMFPIEYGTWKLDIDKIRSVAPTLLGVGGMNKNVLSLDKDAVDKEIERLKPLVELGGYIPCPDHRLPQGTKFELVKYYTSKVKEILKSNN